MSDKPSLYVVEKKEVVVLVILFILVTVLAFTIGVKYGENVGRKAVQVEQVAIKEHAEEIGEGHGGSLGGDKSPEHAATAKDEHGVEQHGTEKVATPHAAEEHGEHTPAKDISAKDSKAKTSTDHNSDEYLLGALKESGMQAPSDREENVATKLPAVVKQPKVGSFAIQIGSFPTKKDAEQQARLYREKKLDVSILAPIKDKQGEWYRVCVGTYSSKSEAEKEAKHLKDKALIHSYFVRRVN